MAIPADCVWSVDASAGSSDINGGGFSAGTAGSGTDYSLVPNPQLSHVDAVSVGTTIITSAIGGFTTAMIGNAICFSTGGGGAITPTCYIIVGRTSTNSITVDRNVPANTAMVYAVGGSHKTPGMTAGQSVTSNQVWVKAGTYALTTATPNISGGTISSPGGTAAAPCKWEGYQTTRGDKGTRPVIQDGSVTGSNILATSASYTIFDNIEMSGTHSTNTLIELQNASCRAIRCKTSGAANGFDTGAAGTEILFCEGANTTSTPFSLRGACSVYGCVAHGSSVSGFTIANDDMQLNRCISYGNAVHGFSGGAGDRVNFVDCTAYGNTLDGFDLSTSGAAPAAHCIDCVATGNGRYGFNAAAASGFIDLIHCATYNNTSGGINSNLTLTEGPVTLTADPFTNAAGGDFSLNTTSGGGAALRAGGVPGVFPGGLTAGHPDIGAAQHADPPGPTLPPAFDVYSGVDRGDGVLGTLHASNIATAAGAGVNLSAGILKSGSVVDDVTGTYTGGGGGGGSASSNPVVTYRQDR